MAGLPDWQHLSYLDMEFAVYRLPSLAALLAVLCTGCFFGGSEQVAEAPATTTATADTTANVPATPASPSSGGGMSDEAGDDYMSGGGGQNENRGGDDAPDMEMGYGEDRRREGDGDDAPDMEMGYGEDRRREGDGDGDDAPEMDMGYGEDRREGDGDGDDAPEMEMGYGEDRREGDGGGDDAPEMEMGYGEDRRGGGGDRGGDDAPDMEMGYGEDRRGGGDGAPSMDGDGDGRRGGGGSSQTFAGRAASAFQQGKDGEAIRYLFADGLSNASSQTLTKFRWVKGLKQPALAVRWGIGVNYVPAKGFSGDPRAIGTGPQTVNKGGGNGRDGGGYEDGAGMQMNMDEGGDSSSMGMGMGGGGSRDQDLKKYTGDLGKHVVAELTKRIKTGSFGMVLAEAKGSGGGASREGGGDDFGAMMSMDEGRGGFDGRGGDGNGQAGGSSVTSVTPGVAYLGKGSPKELMAKAEREGVHLLVVFDVRAGKHPRSGVVFNNTKAELFDVKAGKSLSKARELRNMEVENRRKTKENDNTIEVAYKRFFEPTDLAYKVSELPEALSQFASGRVTQLSSGQHPNVLPVLAEIKMYHSRQWIDDAQMATAFAALIGVGDGEKLAKGDAKSKKEVLAKLMKK